jgi:hypothetical protein
VSARTEVHYNGVRWDDIDWSKAVHSLGPECSECGGDSAIGHGPGCPYVWANMESPKGREFLRLEIKKALQREGKLALDALADPATVAEETRGAAAVPEESIEITPSFSRGDQVIDVDSRPYVRGTFLHPDKVKGKSVIWTNAGREASVRTKSLRNDTGAQ